MEKGFYVLLCMLAWQMSFAFSQKNHERTVFDDTVSSQNSFIANAGQLVDQHSETREDILFYGQRNNVKCFLLQNGVSYQFEQSQLKDLSEASMYNPLQERKKALNVEAYRIDITYIGSNSDVSITGKDQAPSRLHFYNAIHPEGILNVASYGQVRYQDLYSGIDLLWYTKGGKLKYDFILDPNMDYQNIQFEVDGATHISVNRLGQLILETPFGSIVEDAPVVFQKNRRIAAKWSVKGNIIGFKIKKTDPSLPLTIDPTVVINQIGSYYGGADQDHILDATLDSSGNFYYTGFTESNSSIATSGSHLNTYAGSRDAFLIKMDRNHIRSWATYYGGNAADDGTAVATTNDGMIYMSGFTSSSSGIATAGTHQSTSNGSDAFLAKFDSSGIRQWATYYGGLRGEEGLDCAVDPSSNVYMVGFTLSDSLIATPGAHQTTYHGTPTGDEDAFIVKFDANGNRLWATYYGGNDRDNAFACTIDDSLHIIVGGSTVSSGFIATPGSHKPIGGGFPNEGFVAKFDSNGVRKWGTYYGGFSGRDLVKDIAVDPKGNIYFTGETTSTNNVATTGSHQPTIFVGTAAYLVKFNNAGVRQWGTYYAGFGSDQAHSLVLDMDTNIYIAGTTKSTNNIATTGSHQVTRIGASDAFVAKFNQHGVRQWGSYFGGNNDDGANACLVNANGDVFLAGYTTSTSGIATINSHQNSIGGGVDGFLSGFHQCDTDSTHLTVEACDTYTSPSALHTWTASGIYYDTLSNVAGCDSIIAVDLTIDSSQFHQINAVSCDSFVSPSGKHTYYQSGFFSDTLTSAQGCDSIVFISLTIPQFNLAVSYDRATSTITSQEASGQYQWMECDSGIIAGATGRSYQVPSDGRYAVILTKNGCKDTSECETVLNVGIGETSSLLTYTLSPNPTAGDFLIKFDKKYSTISMIITNTVGQEITRIEKEYASQINATIPGEAGWYLVHVSLDQLPPFSVPVMKH